LKRFEKDVSHLLVRASSAEARSFLWVLSRENKNSAEPYEHLARASLLKLPDYILLERRLTSESIGNGKKPVNNTKATIPTDHMSLYES
jgi:hypothetical protein